MKSKLAPARVIHRSPVAVLALLAACGGGGSGGPVSAPTPAPVPTPTPSPSQPLSGPVTIFKAPATQEFTAYTLGDAMRIRFDAATGNYQVMIAGRDWDTLIDEENSPPGSALFASAPGFNQGYFSYRTNTGSPSPELQYHYASYAHWQMRVEGQTREGTIAFAAPTPPGGVPVTGSATYRGPIFGSADFVADGGGWGKFDPAPINGLVTLDFDFAAGKLGGRIMPQVGCDCDQVPLPTLQFTDTVFASGSPTFSGRFATSASGANAFSGRFAGPQAQELVGEWTFPFVLSGAQHTATGVWIAKRGN